MLEVNNLSVSFGSLKAVSSVSFSLSRREVLGIIGESGSGKTTLARAIMRLVPKKNISEDSRVVFQGRELFSLHQKELKPLRKEIQMIFQDPLSSFNPRIKVGKAVEEGLLIHNIDAKSQRKGKVLEILEQVGLSQEAYDKYPHEFSGGQRQRIAIARALVLQPACILADEPVSSLDVSVQAQILNLLLKLKDEYNLSYLLISHDLGVVDYLCDKVLVLYQGQMMEYGPKKILQAPFHPYTRLLLDSLPEMSSKTDLKELPEPGITSLCPFYPRCDKRSVICGNYDGRVIALSGDHQTTCVRQKT